MMCLPSRASFFLAIFGYLETQSRFFRETEPDFLLVCLLLLLQVDTFSPLKYTGNCSIHVNDYLLKILKTFTHEWEHERYLYHVALYIMPQKIFIVYFSTMTQDDNLLSQRKFDIVFVTVWYVQFALGCPNTSSIVHSFYISFLCVRRLSPICIVTVYKYKLYIGTINKGPCC